MSHNLLMTSYDDLVTGSAAIVGQCSCSAWFELRVMLETQQIACAVYQNNYPPCPAVGACHAFEEELARAPD